METYLVGGAVRDKNLSYPFIERDWVVVGSSPEHMLKLGYRQVGKDFPVFLHPQTNEEYALARTERKQGHGYTGFTVYAAPDVTLEQDLARRDLTINAMAESNTGKLIDPYDGLTDLKHRILRHVSPAFSEDPLRVLRVARFAARYAHLGFSIAPETLVLMQDIAHSGELQHLVPERIWAEFAKSLGEKTPTKFIETLRDCHGLAEIMPELDQLFGVPQNAQHHPEIDTGIHSLMCLEQATLLSDDSRVRFAALVHDLGKGTTKKADLPRHIAHEIRGLPLIKALCERLRIPREHSDLALLSCEYHTHVHRALELKPSTVMKVLEATDALRRPERFELFLLSCEADSRGRTGFEDRLYPQAQIFRELLLAAASVEPATLIAQGITGKKLGEAIRVERISRISAARQEQHE
ncbi:MAG: multifunctional CCA addition/repair protein [Pseudomonadales bacterium]